MIIGIILSALAEMSSWSQVLFSDTSLQSKNRRIITSKFFNEKTRQRVAAAFYLFIFILVFHLPHLPFHFDCAGHQT